MSNFLDDILFMNWRDWYGKLYICGKPVSRSLTSCNFLNIVDILMLQKTKHSLDEYIIIMSPKFAYSADMYVKTCRL